VDTREESRDNDSGDERTLAAMSFCRRVSISRMAVEESQMRSLGLILLSALALSDDALFVRTFV
jgi:hypothetical protein